MSFNQIAEELNLRMRTKSLLKMTSTDLQNGICSAFHVKGVNRDWTGKYFWLKCPIQNKSRLVFRYFMESVEPKPWEKLRSLDFWTESAIWLTTWIKACIKKSFIVIILRVVWEIFLLATTMVLVPAYEQI